MKFREVHLSRYYFFSFLVCIEILFQGPHTFPLFRHFPVILVGLTAVGSGLAALALPDKHEDTLPDTVNDCETSDDDDDDDEDEEDEEERLTSVTSPTSSLNTPKLIDAKLTMDA